MKRFIYATEETTSTPLVEAANAYAQNPSSKNYEELKKCVFELEWQGIVEDIIDLSYEYDSRSEGEGAAKKAADIIKKHMKR